MPIYLELLDDEDYINEVCGFASVLIVGCIGCANESLAYKRGLPFLRDQQAYAIDREMKRVAELMSSRAFVVSIETPRQFLCLLSDNESKQLRAGLPRSDAILVLGCPAAVEGLKVSVGDTLPVVLGMKPRGFLFYRMQLVPDIGHTIAEAELSSLETWVIP